MEFNRYVWQLYANSPKGKRDIKYYRELKAKDYENSDVNLDQERTVSLNLVDAVREHAAKTPVKSEKDARNLFRDLVVRGLPVYEPGDEKKRTPARFILGKIDHVLFNSYIPDISSGLFLAHPEFFVPYDFDIRFNDFQAICEVFGIPIPPIPKKTDREGACNYYYEINKALLEFGKRYGLNTYDLCAFLYDFASQFIERPTDEIPSPSKVWLILANYARDSQIIDRCVREDGTAAWGGNVNTLRGDILLMYEPAPRSHVRSIWRAVSDGFKDPFFYWQSTVLIGKPIETVPVGLQEMREDKTLGQMGAVRLSFRVQSGVGFTVEQYKALLDIMKKNGQDITKLPRIEHYHRNVDTSAFVSERDVEEQIVEPFLRERLGYNDHDWIRQLPIKMGQGGIFYPDYAIGAKGKRGEESAKMILETKLTLSTPKLLTNAFYQAKSYALRLQCMSMLLASREGLWVFSRERGDFNINDANHATWQELDNKDRLRSIKMLIGKRELHRKTSKT